MRFEDLKAATVQQLGGEEKWLAAQDLVHNGQVHFRYRTPDRLEAAVQDNDNWYSCAVTLVDDSLECACTCPEGEGGWCTCGLAVLAAWLENPTSFLDRTLLREQLKQYSKSELIKIILELADKVMETRDLLKEESPDLDTLLESVDQIFASVGASGSLDFVELEEKLRQAQDKADRLAQMGRLSEARATYFYLLDNLYGLEEEVGQSDIFSDELRQELFEEYCQLIHEDRHVDRTLVQQEIEQLETRAAFLQDQPTFAELKKQFLGQTA
ncbi:MAG: SWIM zinc finger family protein [Desulfobacca sp.]|uniref:SWIM zinc finger family protein n=1 Tax=Desulfobacca sp. TaxID=2067990 RepID=UPI00404A8B1A